MLFSYLFILSLSLFVSIECHKSNPINLNNENDEQNILDNVFDWVFGEPNDDHELKHHFNYLRGQNDATKDDEDLAKIAKELDIKPEFFNFKAHDYNDDDQIDGLELLAMFFNERPNDFIENNQNPNKKEQKMKLYSKAIDWLLQQEDRNNDGFLDFSEYSQARHRIAKLQQKKN